MLSELISNGYVFWGVVGVLLVALSIIYANCDFSQTNYTSWWGRFLQRHTFKKFAMAMLFLSVVAELVGLYFNKKSEPNEMAFFCLSAVSALLVVLFFGALLMQYCKWCWGTLPLVGILRLLLPLGFIYGAILYITHPAIPDGMISSAFWAAVKLNVDNDRSFPWLECVRLSDFQTYVSVMRDSVHWRVVLYGWIGVCLLQIVFRNGWMHCCRLRHRILNPAMACAISFLAMPIVVALGFVLCAWALCALMVVVYVVVGLIVLWLLITVVVPLMFQAATESVTSSGGCSGGGGSYSSGMGSSSGGSMSSGTVTTTYKDSDGCEYKGSGENPDTIEKQSPGDHAVFDRCIDGSYVERFGNRTLKPESPWD